MQIVCLPAAAAYSVVQETLVEWDAWVPTAMLDRLQRHLAAALLSLAVQLEYEQN